MDFMVPSVLKISSPSFSIHTAPSLAGAAILASPVFKAVAPSAPDIPASPNMSVIAARSVISHPTDLQIGPAMAMDSNKSVTVVFACAWAFDRISAAVDAYVESLPNIFRAFPSPPVTSERSVAVPAARFSAGVSMSAASAALKPCRAKFSVASAASCIPNTELAAACLTASSSFAASSADDPMVACTNFSALSTLPNS